MATAAAPTLRDKQRTALESLLALNASSSSSSTSTGITATAGGGHGSQLPTWKVLVMDKVGQDVLATSLRVQDLRHAGVTLHVSVSSLLSLSKRGTRPRVRRSNLTRLSHQATARGPAPVARRPRRLLCVPHFAKHPKDCRRPPETTVRCDLHQLYQRAPEALARRVGRDRRQGWHCRRRRTGTPYAAASSSVASQSSIRTTDSLVWAGNSRAHRSTTNTSTTSSSHRPSSRSHRPSRPPRRRRALPRLRLHHHPRPVPPSQTSGRRTRSSTTRARPRKTLKTSRTASRGACSRSLSPWVRFTSPRACFVNLPTESARTPVPKSVTDGSSSRGRA